MCDERTHGTVLTAFCLALALLLQGSTPAAEPLLPLGPSSWTDDERGTIRGVTVGPIENALHADKGYGTHAYLATLRELKRWGAGWVSLTVFGRISDLSPKGISYTFEQPYEQNRAAVRRAVLQAHALGLKVFLVPHLWVESGGWRGEIEFDTDEAWQDWARAYGPWVLSWAELARDAQVDMFCVGVELRSWLTTHRAPSFLPIIRDIRHVYKGLLTYAANWDDAQDTVIWGELDVIGVNAFYPLADKQGATFPDLFKRSQQISDELEQLSREWQRPLLFTEFGYTTRRDPALRPWEWPDHMDNVRVDQAAQADAYAALLAAFIDKPWFVGWFAWRVYADPDDVSQEAEWGFSPRGKLAELVLRDSFTAHFAADGPRPPGAALHRHRADRIGVY